MGRQFSQPAHWRSIAVPLRVIKQIYGLSQNDNAGDDMINALQEVSEWPQQYRYRFAYDTTDPNPWFHTMIFEAEGLPDSVFARLVELLREHGLAQEGTS